jgi:hypothetical protein
MASADQLDKLLCIMIMNERVFNNEKVQEINMITGLIERFWCAIRHFHFLRSEQQRCLNHLPVRSVLRIIY